MENENRNNSVLVDLSDKDEIRKVIIAAEILQRKY